MSSDVSFEEIILEDAGFSESESNKENSDKLDSRTRNYKQRGAPRTEKQLELLIANAPSKSLSNEEKVRVWKNLTPQLNDIGPPKHGWEIWRSVWGTYKAKVKALSAGTNFVPVTTGRHEDFPEKGAEALIQAGDVPIVIDRMVDLAEPIIVSPPETNDRTGNQDGPGIPQVKDADIELPVLLCDLRQRLIVLIDCLKNVVETVENLTLALERKLLNE